MILYVENLKESTKKFPELIHEFSKVSGYKINIKKSVAFLYTSIKAAKSEIKESNQFTTASKTIIYLGINLTKQVKELYLEKYGTFMKEAEEDMKK